MPVAVSAVPAVHAGDTAAVCRLDKRAADECLTHAAEALRSGDLSTARTAIRDALERHPGLMYVYRELGLVLSQLGLKGSAERCFQGVLPDFVAEQWFPERGRRVVPGEGGDVERHVCHEPIARELRAPKGIAAPTDRMFERRSMTSTRAIVDRAPGGALWFDGFNRAMFDGAGAEIEGQSRGNPALIRSIVRGAEPHRVDGRAFFVGNRGYNNYYHWMLDILPSIALFRQAGYEIRPEDRLLVFAAGSGFQKGTLAHLGFAPEQVVEMGHVSPYVRAEEMIAPFYLNAMALQLGDWVPAFLQEHFLGGEASVPPMPKLYLARARNARNGRAIENEGALVEFLEARGFSTLYPEDYSVTEQAAIFARAETVLAPHGAGLTNIAFCRPGTKVIELYGNFIASCYWAMSEVGGLDYYNHCCSTTERGISYQDRSQKDLPELRQRGFSVNLNELEALLEEAERG